GGVSLDAARRPDPAGVDRPRGARPGLRRARPPRPVPAAARDHTRRDALRPPRERARDRPVRRGRDAARARVPERPLLKRLLQIALTLWIARWAAGELASYAARAWRPA